MSFSIVNFSTVLLELCFLLAISYCMEGGGVVVSRMSLRFVSSFGIKNKPGGRRVFFFFFFFLKTGGVCSGFPPAPSLAPPPRVFPGPAGKREG